MSIPVPTVQRLASIYSVIKRLEDEKVEVISSKGIGEILGISPFTVRKDINHLNLSGMDKGYEVRALKEALDLLFGISRHRRACIAGLGRLGCAIMNFNRYLDEDIRIAAGFDSNINVVETVVTSIPVFPAFELTEKVRSMDIELGIIAVPPEYAQITADRMIKGGIKGILNFAPVIIKTERSDVSIKNFNITEELRALTLMIKIKEKEMQDEQDI